MFFSQWTAWFDYALAGLVASAMTREAGWMIAGVPYARYMRDMSRQWGRRQAAAYVLGAPLVDAVTLAGFLTGSVTWRSLVL